MDKKQLSERDICTKCITPALRRAGWDEQTQLREGVSFTKGRNYRGAPSRPRTGNGVPHVSSREVEAAQIWVRSLPDQHRFLANLH